MMHPAAFIALVERCAPAAPVECPASVVRQASGCEPLAITFQSGKPLSVQATSEAEAIALATGMTIAGHRVRIGLAGRDTRDFAQLPRRLKPATPAARAVAR